MSMQESTVPQQIDSAPKQEAMGPTHDGFYYIDAEGQHGATADEVPVGELVPCSATCCDIASLNFAWPQCFGCAMEGVFLCDQAKCLCCKCPTDEQKENGVLLACVKEERNLIMPFTLCQYKCQEFCVDYRCALPCTKDVPNLFNVCFINCLADFKPAFGVMKKVKDYIPRYAEEK